MERLRYKPLDRESGAIRLVRLLPGTDEPIRLELIPSNLDQESCIPYETLSYARGFFNEGRAVEVDGQQLTITRNGSLALLSLRRANEDLILWVEEICINQSDHEEKLRQKRKLKTIYDRAERLFMWLADSTSEEAQLSQLPTLPTIIHGNKVHVVEIGPGSPSWQSGLHQVTADTVSCSTGASSPAGPSEIICDTDGCVAIFSGMYRKDNLARHKRLKHKGPVVYECEDLLCDRVFYSRDVRTKHYRRWHPSLAGMSMHQYSDYFRHAELRELLPVSGDEPDFLGGKSGGGSQVALTDDNISSTKNSHTFINSSSDREEFDGMTKVSLGESHRVLDAWVQQQKFEDVDVQSLVSEEGDAASSTSMPLPSWARETELTIVGVFANSSILSPLYSRALQLMPEERFINNFRRLLKAFHGNLVASDNSNVTRQLAKLLKSKQRQSRIARMVVARHVALQSSWNEEDLATLRDQEKQAYTNVEGWLDRTIVSSAIIDTQADRSGDMDKEFESGNDSDSESNGEENMSHFAQYPRLDLAVQRLVEGRPFQDMLASFKELLLPPGLLKELLPIPRDSVTYGTTEETGLLSTVQGFF
ncbi:unnamed protein product [Alternaria alternata]|uniref:C2H2-type domain-containing protein n=1 Tax=Alternaria tenuissima TaxID=119927 RepID=A0AB37WPF6_9PLEO|nr:HET-like protein [Alternaria alternata]RYN30839.1 hypothetical protein AA0115_g4644 [Alternaria tenuissima]RYO03399.1 hypothetical protein AA0119_g4883 [Alternaria tenuissima]RYO19579.1 hypothetical protein AA0121_g4180 [Alternaria tenuissima]